LFVYKSPKEQNTRMMIQTHFNSGAGRSATSLIAGANPAQIVVNSSRTANAASIAALTLNTTYCETKQAATEVPLEVFCDVCPAQMCARREYLEAAGWFIGRREAFCPDCNR
jgi:hypothetical protein